MAEVTVVDVNGRRLVFSVHERKLDELVSEMRYGAGWWHVEIDGEQLYVNLRQARLVEVRTEHDD